MSLAEINISIIAVDDASRRLYKAMKRTDAVIPKLLLAMKGYRIVNYRGRNKLEQV